MSVETAPSAALRADAARNAAALVAAGRRVLREHGPDFPFTVVATEAGLGRATLYRHFPSREDLVAAIVAENVERLERDLAPTGAAPHRAAGDVLATVADVLLDNVELTQLLAAGSPLVEDARDRVVAVVRDALSAAVGHRVDDRTAGVTLLMLAASAVQSPPGDRRATTDAAVSVLTDGIEVHRP